MASISIWLNTGLQDTSGTWVPPPVWTQSTAYTAPSDGVKPSVPNGFNYRCGSSGTSGTTEPNWPTTLGEWVWSSPNWWLCSNVYVNPTPITGEPFGHPFNGSLWWLYKFGIPTDYIDATYLTGSTYDVASLVSSHEVATCRFRINNGSLVIGKDYRVVMIWTKGSIIICQQQHVVTWGSWGWYQSGSYIGWTPCWWWPGGSHYDPNGSPAYWQEIMDDGTDFAFRVELRDDGTGALITHNTKTFSIDNAAHTSLEHTILHGDITNYDGSDADRPIALKVTHVGDSGKWYTKKNDDHSYVMKCDGIAGSAYIQVVRSGYKKETKLCTGVVERDFNEYDFDGTATPLTSVYGTVIDSDGHGIENANVFGVRAGAMYGCKTAASGDYALPLHTAGTYTIKAAKNNFEWYTHASTVAQTTDHPTVAALRNITLVRPTNYLSGTYAHLDALAADKQSMIIPDDMSTSNVPVIPTSVGASVVKLRNRVSAGAAGSGGTSSGAADSGIGYGSGVFNYDGDMGDGEGWSDTPEHEDDPPDKLYYWACSSRHVLYPLVNCYPCSEDLEISWFQRSDWGRILTLYPVAWSWSDPTYVGLGYWDHADGTFHDLGIFNVGDQFGFAGSTYQILEIHTDYSPMYICQWCWFKFFEV